MKKNIIFALIILALPGSNWAMQKARRSPKRARTSFQRQSFLPTRPVQPKSLLEQSLDAIAQQKESKYIIEALQIIPQELYFALAEKIFHKSPLSLLVKIDLLSRIIEYKLNEFSEIDSQNKKYRDLVSNEINIIYFFNDILINQSVNPRWVINSKSLFNFAIERQNLDALKYLAKKLGPISINNIINFHYERKTPLERATDVGSPEIVEELLKLGVRVDKPGLPVIRQPIWYAITRGSSNSNKKIKIIELLASKIDINKKYPSMNPELEDAPILDYIPEIYRRAQRKEKRAQENRKKGRRRSLFAEKKGKEKQETKSQESNQMTSNDWNIIYNLLRNMGAKHSDELNLQ